MVAFVGKRLAAGVMALITVATATFFLLFQSAPNVAATILGDDATRADIAAKEAELGLNDPLIVRFGQWVMDALRGDFGVSWFDQQPVTTELMSRLPVTLALVLVAIILTAILATLLGVTAAVTRGWTDRILQVLTVAGASVPQFILAVAIVTVFAINMGLFPATGYVRPNDNLMGWIITITLPVAALTIDGVSSTAQQLRSATIDLLERDYVRTLRSRGLPFREVLFRHVLRGAAPAAFTVLSLRFIGMLGGVVVIEQIFALPGIGPKALIATTQGDMPVLMAVVVYVVVVVVVVNVIVDIINGWLNPKVRVE